METQKKSVVDLTDLAIGILVLGIVVTIGATILLNMRDTSLTNLNVITVTNEKITTGTNNISTLSKTWGKAVTSVTNATGGAAISSGNYTVSVNSANGVMSLNNRTSTYGFPWNVTYTYYDTTRADWSLADDAGIGLGEYGNWFKIIVIVGVASLVLALIFMAFGSRSQTTY